MGYQYHISYLEATGEQSSKLVSNVEIEEVEPVSWNDLRGVDDLIQALEAKIALKPKRGAFLSGPPGTGKATFGRALAHRLREPRVDRADLKAIIEDGKLQFACDRSVGN
jgi:ATP-dependent 26S proteasome regulatory subunit